MLCKSNRPFNFSCDNIVATGFTATLLGVLATQWTKHEAGRADNELLDDLFERSEAHNITPLAWVFDKTDYVVDVAPTDFNSSLSLDILR